MLARETGYGNALAYVGSRLLSRVAPGVTVIRYLLVAQPVPEISPLPPRRRSSVDIRLVPPDQYRYEWFPRPRANIDARFAQGAICFVAFREDRPAACLWLKQGAFLEDEVRCRFVPLPAGSTMWDFDVYVAPEYRGTRIFAYLWDAGFGWARSKGIMWSISRINAFNLQSIRSHTRLGATVVGTATFCVAGRLQLVLNANRPIVHVSLETCPEIHVHAPEPV